MPTARFEPYDLPATSNVNRATLNDFWRQVVELSCAEFGAEKDWSSLRELTSEIDVIVVGRPISVEWRADEYNAIVDFAVDEVLKGDPIWARPNMIQVLDTDATDQVTGTLPTVRTVLFLRNFADSQRDYVANVPMAWEYLYYLPTVYQNVMVDFRSRVFIPEAPRMRRWLSPDIWPLELKGMSFDELLEEIRQFVVQPPEEPGTVAGSRNAC